MTKVLFWTKYVKSENFVHSDWSEEKFLEGSLGHKIRVCFWNKIRVCFWNKIRVCFWKLTVTDLCKCYLLWQWQIFCECHFDLTVTDRQWHMSSWQNFASVPWSDSDRSSVTFCVIYEFVTDLGDRSVTWHLFLLRDMWVRDRSRRQISHLTLVSFAWYVVSFRQYRYDTWSFYLR